MAKSRQVNAQVPLSASLGERNPGALRRRTVLALPFAGALAAAAGCTGSAGGASGKDGNGVKPAAQAPSTALLPTDLGDLSIALSTAIFDSSPVAVLTSAKNAKQLAGYASKAGVPVLVASSPQSNAAVAKEIGRLKAETLVVPKGEFADALGTKAEVKEVDPANPDEGALPAKGKQASAASSLTLLVDPKDASEARAFAAAVAQGHGAQVVQAAGLDPRATSESIKALASRAGKDPAYGVLGVPTESSAMSPEFFPAAVATAATSPELPGGGQLIVPSRRMIAAYGSPGIPSLGILGEQDLEASITRVKDMAKGYEDFSEVPVIPAFEVIATVASGSAGADGDYSAVIPVEALREWVDRAVEEGVYVVLDLQPGRTDFLTQAKIYEELLKRPHVGLALDAEWRLKPNQVHLKQIGSVHADEVNQVAEWLAALTRENALPQKAFILHQFANSMIREREKVNASHPELSFLLHADGHGSPDLKMGTWNALQKNLPEGIHMAWKNFIDEDTPTFTPKETFEIEPRPWFVSYQ